MGMEHWWNDTERGKLKYWEKKKPVTVPLCRSCLTENTAYPIQRNSWTIKIAETKYLL